MKKLKKEKARQQLSEMMDMFTDADTAYRDRRQAKEFENAAFARGYQHARTETGHGSTFIDEEEAVETQNIIRPVIRAMVAARLRQLPNPEIATRSEDPRSHTRAEAIERACKAASHNGMVDWEEVYRTVKWAGETGLGFLKVFWDPDAGPEDSQDEVFDTEDLDEDGEEDPGVFDDASEDHDVFGALVEGAPRMGDIQTMFVPTTDCLPNADARSWREVRHMFHVRLLPESFLLDTFTHDYFGKKLEGFSQEREGSARDMFRWGQQDDYGFEGGTSGRRGTNLVEFVEFWEIPSRKYPNGRFGLFAGSVLIHIGPNWLNPKRLPFVPFYGGNVVSVSLYPDGDVEDMKSPQETLNRIASKLRENIDKVQNQHLFVPRGSGIRDSDITDQPGQIIHYTKGYKPEYSDVPPLPPALMSYQNEIVERANLISGYSDFTRGHIPQGQQVSGRAIVMASEKETAMREPDMILQRKSFFMVYQHILWLMKQFYGDGRMLKVIGEGGTWELAEFKSDDFSGLDDMVPEIYSGGPTSPAARFVEIAEMKETGMFDDDPAAERARDMLDTRYYKKSTSDPMANDRQRARRENTAMQRGEYQDVAVQQFDDHRVHLDVHNKFRKSMTYENMPPLLKMVIDAHCDQHENELEIQQIDYGQQQQMMAGQPPQLALQEGMPEAQQQMTSPYDGGASPYGESEAQTPMQQEPVDFS